MNSDEDNAGHDQGNLHEELDETATSLPVEAAPSVKEANNAGATHHLLDDLATEGAVKRHNGVLLFGQDGSLNADQGDHGWKAKEEGSEDGEDENGDDTHDERGPLCTFVVGEVLLLKLVQSEEHAEASDHVKADVGHSGLNSSGNGKSLPLFPGRDTLPEGLGSGHADDLVCPCSVEVGDKGTRDTSNDDGLCGDRGKRGAEELGRHHKAESVDAMLLDTTEASPAASVSDEMLNGAADAGGDGLLVDESDGGSGLKKAFLLLVVARLVCGGRYSDGGDGALDHTERGDDRLKHVGQLRDISIVHDSNGGTQRETRTRLKPIRLAMTLT